MVELEVARADAAAVHVVLGTNASHSAAANAQEGLHKREMCKSSFRAYIAAELGQRAVVSHSELRDLAVGAGGCVDGLAVRAHQDVRAPATTHTHQLLA